MRTVYDGGNLQGFSASHTAVPFPVTRQALWDSKPSFGSIFRIANLELFFEGCFLGWVLFPFAANRGMRCAMRVRMK
jgi:hypothetical protein